MKKYKYLIPKFDTPELHLLEVYLFRLIRLIETVEFKKDLKILKQKKVYAEIMNIEHSLQTIRSFCMDMDETAYVAWEIPDPEDESNIATVYSFTCKEVISEIFNIPEREFDERTMEQSGPYDGWFFMELISYKEQLDDPLAFNSDSIINHINFHRDEEENS
jgi:hypothetical protein